MARIDQEAAQGSRVVENLKIEGLRYEIEYRIERSRESLIRRSRELAAQLNRVADRLEEEPEMRVWNSLGEVQGRGSDIDRECALLAAAWEEKVRFEYLIEEEK